MKVATKKEQANYKADRTETIAKEIEEKERDLECPVCFDICVAPIYTCDLSHQICQSCRPRMRSCPQCREQYRKLKRRHKEKEEISQQLQALYKTLQQHLETL